ncbi:MAG: FISUMP domain-containing protein [Chitinophagales bacterium]
MKIRIPLVCLTAVLLLNTCKKDEPPVTENSDTTLLDAHNAVDMAWEHLKSTLDVNGGDIFSGLDETALWLSDQAGIDTAVGLDGVYLFIYMESGLKTGITFYPTDADGYSIFRGGGGGDKLTTLTGNCTNAMTNNNVLIYAAAFDEFYKPGEMEQILSIFENSSSDFNVTLLKNAQCSPYVVNSFPDYGLVILDTHGEPEGFRTGIHFKYDTKPTSEDEVRQVIIDQAGVEILNGIIHGDYAQFLHFPFNSTTDHWWTYTDTIRPYYVWISSLFIQENIPDLPNTILYGNMCNSGWTTARPDKNINNPIGTTWINKNPISYYAYTRPGGYSRSVTDIFAKRFEDSLVTSLVIDYDSTGIAHLANQTTVMEDTLDPPYITTQLQFLHYGQDSWCFGCGGQFTDDRDGQTYALVCIGDQTWMAENLKYNAPGSDCYQEAFDNCNIYGRLYDWSTIMNGASSSSAEPSGVQGVCPDGFHVPSIAEWNTLINALGGISLAGGAMKSTDLWADPNTGATNSSGFNALPSDIFNGINWTSIEYSTYMWSTTETAGNPQNIDVILLSNYNGDASTYSIYKVAPGGSAVLAPCRCARN